MSGTYSKQTRISRNPASAPLQSQQVAGSHAHVNAPHGNVPRGNAYTHAARSSTPYTASAPSQSQQVAGSHSASAPAASASTTSNATLPGTFTQPPQPASSPGNSTQPPHPAAPGTFTCLYESKDKKYCLFADENGHLTSVKAHRLS